MNRTELSTALGALILVAGSAMAQVDITPPTVGGAIEDNPRNGVPDTIAVFGQSFSGLLREQSSRENRAVQEYDVSQFAGQTVNSATISGRVNVNNGADNGVRSFQFGIYAGDGVADLTDWDPGATVVGTGSYAPPTDSFFDFSFDVTAEVAAIIGNGGDWVGLWVDPTSDPSFPNILNASEDVAVLTIDASTSGGCLGDIADDNGTLGASDGQVSFGDFLASLGLLGPCGPATGNPDCTGDNADDNGTPGGDGQVSFGDFLFLLGVLGPCP